MPSKKDKITFEGCEPSMLFRDFAAECMELAQTAASPEKRALYMKMASVWFQMAQRWEKSRTTALLFEQPSSGLCILTWIKEADCDPVVGIMSRVVAKKARSQHGRIN